MVLLHQAVGLQLEVGEQHLVVERADDAVDGVLQQDDALFAGGGTGQHQVEQQRLAQRRGHFGHEDRVARVHERLRRVRQQRVHRVAHLVRQREDGVEGVVVIEEHVRVGAVHRRRVGAAPLALVLVDVNPPARKGLPHALLVLGAERGHRVHHPVLHLLVLVVRLVLDQRHERVEHVVVGEAQRALAQLVIAAKGPHAGLGLVNEVLDDARGNGVAEERRIERGGVAARARLKPIALHHAVVHGGVGVDVGDVRVVERLVRRAAVGLRATRGQQLPVLPVAHLRGFAGGERDGGKPGVGRGERGVRIVRHAAQAPREREQALALLVEHVRLLPEHVLDREPVEGQVGRLLHPLAHGGQRQAQQLGIEPRGGLPPPGNQQLHALAPRVHGVVALIFVVLQRRVVPHAEGELAQRVAVTECSQQALGPLRQRPLVDLVGLDAALEIAEAGFPRFPAGEDGAQVPGVLGVDRLTSGNGGRRRGHGCGGHQAIIARLPARQAWDGPAAARFSAGPAPRPARGAAARGGRSRVPRPPGTSPGGRLLEKVRSEK